ncbi:RIP metalloprotease RseP [Thermosulfuriphilus sp.]
MSPALAVILVLSVLILIHELGHFLVARFFNVKVLRFSLGFGPRVWGFTRGDTDYCLSLVPLGGYVKMLGEGSDDPIAPEEAHRAFGNKPLGQRFLIVAAGPLSNLLLAWFLFAGTFLFSGIPYLLPVVAQVQPGSPAEAAGIAPGDKIIAVDGRLVDRWEEVSKAIKKGGKRPIRLKIERDGKILELKVIPEIKKVKNIFGEEIAVPIIGITAAGKFAKEKVGPFEALKEAGERTWAIISLTVQGFIKLIQRVIPFSTLGGPILIAQMAGEQARAGLANLAFFTGVLSVNLGILNLLPIPVLDGGHLFFFTLEALIGRPISVRKREIAQQIGMVILIALMIFVFYNDILRILGQR